MQFVGPLLCIKYFTLLLCTVLFWVLFCTALGLLCTCCPSRFCSQPHFVIEPPKGEEGRDFGGMAREWFQCLGLDLLHVGLEEGHLDYANVDKSRVKVREINGNMETQPVLQD